MGIRVCPRCASIVYGKKKSCSNCGYVFNEEKKLTTDMEKQSSQFLTKNERKNVAEAQENKEGAPTDASVNAVHAENVQEAQNEQKTTKRHKHKPKRKHVAMNVDEVVKQEGIVAKKQEDGTYTIDTSDVTYLPQDASYSVKKARGEYTPPKIQWWEIYKWADLYLARRKIKKQVNKAAVKKPEEISYVKMFFLALFLGWFGAHVFYANDKKRGWAMLIMTVVCFSCATVIMKYSSMQYWLGTVVGVLGLILFCMWISDLVRILFKKFRFRDSKLDFIRTLDIKTRATLSKKYIDLEKIK